MTRACPACSASDARPAGVKDGFEIVRCADCLTLYVLIDPAALLDYSAYHHWESDAFTARRLKEIVAGFEPHRLTNKLLDIGCGAGAFIEAACDLGWEAVGVEVSESAIEIATSKGLCVVSDYAELPPESFDIIIMSEVLEHVLGPADLLLKARRALRPCGLLWATTPHGRGISMRTLGNSWSIVSPPEHVQLFSIGGMRRLLSRAEFVCRCIKAESVNPYELVAGYKRRPINRVEAGRQLNTSVSSRPTGRLVKKTVNRVLSLTHMGDTLKIKATKPL